MLYALCGRTKVARMSQCLDLDSTAYPLDFVRRRELKEVLGHFVNLYCELQREEHGYHSKMFDKTTPALKLPKSVWLDTTKQLKK